MVATPSSGGHPRNAPVVAKEIGEMKVKKDWEIKKLGEVGTFVRGGNFSKKDFVENGFPCIHYGQIHTKFGIETLRHISSVPSEMVKSDRCAKKGDLVIAITSEDDAGSCKCTTWMGDYDVYVGGHIAIYHHTMQPKYVSYYFNSPQFQKAKLEFTHGFKVVEINPNDIAKITIPVPPLEEQKRIVIILDQKFAEIEKLKTNAQTQLQNAKNLFQAELEKQFGLQNPECRIVKLDEVAKKIFAGGDAPKTNYSKTKTKEYQIPIYANAIKDNGLYGYTDNPEVLESAVTVAARGSGTGYVIERNEPFLPIVRLIVVIPKKEILINSYLFYTLKRLPIKHSGSAIPQLTVPMIKEYSIPIPPLPEQKRIVKELDTLSEKVRQLQEIYTKQIANCDELKQAYLQKAFEGEL